MAYKDALSEVIQSSGLSIKDIAAQCKKYGVSITPSYISMLKSGKMSPPSDEVSRAIAKACNYQTEYLVIEAYLDKAPKLILDHLNGNRFCYIDNQIRTAKRILSQHEYEMFEKSMKATTLAEYILNHDPYFIEFFMEAEHKEVKVTPEEKRDYITSNLLKEISITISDTSMVPNLPKGCQVFLQKQEKYDDNDIVGFYINNDTDRILVRQLVYPLDKDSQKTNNPILQAFNYPEYRPIVFDSSNTIIVGKVFKAIINY